MKRYVYLFSVTAVIVGMIIMSGFLTAGGIYEAETFVIKTRDMDNTVTGSGKLRYSSGKNIRSYYSGIAGEINVKNGDTVKSGDILYTIYKADESYTSMLSDESISALLGSMTGSNDASGIIAEAKKYCTPEAVYSDTDGTVTDLSVHEDDIIKKDAVVMKITDTNTLEIPVDINELDIGLIETGQKAEISFTAMPDRKFSGEVTAVADEAEQTSGLTGRETTVEVTVTLDSNEPTENLRAGYSASCSVITSTDKDVLVLPYEQIRTDDNGDFVFLMKDNRAIKKYIKTGREYKYGAEISDGLKSGDIIIDSKEDVTEGQNVIIKQHVVNSDA